MYYIINVLNYHKIYYLYRYSNSYIRGCIFNALKQTRNMHVLKHLEIKKYMRKFQNVLNEVKLRGNKINSQQ
jgi:hypothetical protein